MLRLLSCGVSAERASVTHQDNIVIVGIDPQRGFGSDNPLFKIDWVAGCDR